MASKPLELNVDFQITSKSGNTGNFSVQPLELQLLMLELMEFNMNFQPLKELRKMLQILL